MNAIGQPISRADGRLKVTGRADYTADIPVEGMTHAAIVHSTIANGRTAGIDTRKAEAAPGVLAVFTHRNMPRMNPTPQPGSLLHPSGQSYLPVQDEPRRSRLLEGFRVAQLVMIAGSGQRNQNRRLSRRCQLAQRAHARAA